MAHIFKGPRGLPLSQTYPPKYRSLEQLEVFPVLYALHIIYNLRQFLLKYLVISPQSQLLHHFRG